MSATFFLVRHAIKERAIGDVSITPKGKEQAQMTAHYFHNVSIGMIVTSPLRRAKETASFIAALKSEIPLKEDGRLRERANWGDLAGQTFEEFVALWDRCTQNPEYIPPVGDSAKQAGARLASLLSELGDHHSSESSIVVVTHGGLITDFMVHTFPESELNNWHPDFVAAQSELISECSITKLIYDRGQYRIEGFASTEHLNARS
ncbi:histidine phosphatase family protein [Paenibacillus humicus]|uniref:histidine phosphatase family protein n=1 Tax=Paenibacillus humicus TaxID=412861 RepID=UPI000FD947DA|nr:histidine phosphatase family protein [Paenibacillus humicus]